MAFRDSFLSAVPKNDALAPTKTEPVIKPHRILLPARTQRPQQCSKPPDPAVSLHPAPVTWKNAKSFCLPRSTRRLKHSKTCKSLKIAHFVSFLIDLHKIACM